MGSDCGHAELRRLSEADRSRPHHRRSAVAGLGVGGVLCAVRSRVARTQNRGLSGALRMRSSAMTTCWKLRHDGGVARPSRPRSASAGSARHARCPSARASGPSAHGSPRTPSTPPAARTLRQPERAKRAEQARKAYLQRLALRARRSPNLPARGPAIGVGDRVPEVSADARSVTRAACRRSYVATPPWAHRPADHQLCRSASRLPVGCSA